MSPLRLRLATLLLPPLGLILLWGSENRTRRKLLGTLGIAVYSLLYAGFIIFLLIRFASLQVEWRGGYAPALTWHKTSPNYEALERDRASRAAANNASVAPAPRTSSYWSGFRGPLRDGVYEEIPIRTNWPAGGLPLLWRQPCGGGYSSFAVADGRVFTLEQRRDQEVLVAYSVEDGHELWRQGWPAEFRDFYAEGGPRSTATYSDGLVYALGALGTLQCVEATTGKQSWSHEILAENHGDVPSYGLSASPLVLGQKLIILSGAGHGHSVVCHEKRTGKLLWSALDDTTGYASPMLMELAGTFQIVVSCETRTVGLNPEDGKLLWEYPWRVRTKQLPIAQPVAVSTNRFILSAGYFTGAAAVEITRATSGFAARTVWQNSFLKNKFTSSVCWRGFLYGLDEDILTCLDANTGERKWKGERYGYGQLLLASGHLVILSGEGELALAPATPDPPRELARFQAIHGKTWNHPAISDGRLLVRNSVEMACFDIRPAKSP
jgi:outer membrane protein assembly factor BamB